jgi:hypothetical protein
MSDRMTRRYLGDRALKRLLGAAHAVELALVALARGHTAGSSAAMGPPHMKRAGHTGQHGDGDQDNAHELAFLGGWLNIRGSVISESSIFGRGYTIPLILGRIVYGRRGLQHAGAEGERVMR